MFFECYIPVSEPTPLIPWTDQRCLNFHGLLLMATLDKLSYTDALAENTANVQSKSDFVIDMKAYHASATVRKPDRLSVDDTTSEGNMVPAADAAKRRRLVSGHKRRPLFTRLLWLHFMQRRRWRQSLVTTYSHELSKTGVAALPRFDLRSRLSERTAPTAFNWPRAAWHRRWHALTLFYTNLLTRAQSSSIQGGVTRDRTLDYVRYPTLMGTGPAKSPRT
jgi:hypothetical protein